MPNSDDYDILDVRDLVDDYGNAVEEVRLRVLSGLDSLAAGKKLVVCCDRGISRSNAIAAGILARHQNIPFRDAILATISSTGEQSIKLGMLSSVRLALGEELPSPGNGKRVLITGENTIGIGGTEAKLSPAVDFAELDCLVKENGINVVVHLDDPLTKKTNLAAGETIASLRNVLDICRDNAAHFIFASSFEVYGGGNKETDESASCNPKGLYGETKYIAEQLISLYTKKYDLESAVLRLATPYGDGKKPRFLYSFLTNARDNKEITTHRYRNGFPLVDFVNVSDVKRAIESVIEKNVAGTFNVGSGEGISTNEVADMILERVGKKGFKTHIDVLDIAPNIVMNCAKAEDTFDWRPRILFRDWLIDAVDEFDKSKG